jgi:hypothetical protein
LITSDNGSIVDGDGSAPDDYDVIAHNIDLNAENGTVGVGGDEIEKGHPYDFSYLWDNVAVGNPDSIADGYTELLNDDGDWIFGTTSQELTDGSWYFHVSALDYPTPDNSPCGEGGCPAIEIEQGPLASLAAYRDEEIRRCPTQVSEAADIGPFLLKTDVPPPPPPPPPPPEDDTFFQSLTEDRVYYEILEPSQYLSYEPAQAIGLYAYHPLSSADLSAFDEIQLDAGAYEFISDNIEMKKKADPYYGLQ